MKTIKFWTRFDERQDKHYYDTAQILDKAPAVGDEIFFSGCREIVDAVQPAWIDAEQPHREVFDYDIFYVEIHDAEDGDSAWRYVAVEKETE